MAQIGRINSRSPINANTFTKADVIRAIERIYADYPVLMKAAMDFLLN